MDDLIWTFCFSRAKWCSRLRENEWTDIYPDPHQERAYSAFDYLNDAEACERLKTQVVDKLQFNPREYWFGEYSFGRLQDFTISNQELDVCFDIVPEMACLKKDIVYLSWRVSERYTYRNRKRQNDAAAWSLLTRADALDTVRLVS